MDNITEEFVNVAVRIRPSLNILEDSVAVKVVTKYPPVLLVNNNQSYTYNYIFTPETSQTEIYNDIVNPLVKKVMLGYNCTIFAYGQTGTGKTYTMGSDPKMYTEPGFILRTFDELFGQQQVNDQLEINVSFYEIYNEKVFDLLSNTKKSLPVKGFKVEGLTQVQVLNAKDAQYFLNIGSINRHVGETKLNTNSSRSHAIFTIYCGIKNATFETEAKLNFVDLAGSESVRRTGNEGFQFQEGININMGLFNVRRVMNALSNNLRHIPYRECMITTILQDSLSKNNFVTFVACISPDLQDVNETLQTLEFAKQAKKVKNKPEVHNIVQQYKKQNPVAKQQTPLKRQHASMECTPVRKKPTVINHTWTPMSAVSEEVRSANSISISPIIRECTAVLEKRMIGKLEKHMTTMIQKTPMCFWDELKTEVAQIVRNEMVQMTGQRTYACSSPLERLNSDDDNSFGVAKRLEFDDTEFVAPTKRAVKMKNAPVRRSLRLSKLPKVDVSVDEPKRRQSMRLLKKTSPQIPMQKRTPKPKTKSKDLLNDSYDHQKYVLNILNEGDERELKKLSTIGPKSAAQIHLYRKLNGPFTSVKDLRKLESWRGQSYQRFLKSNFLTDIE
ncbi:hypothetical protein FQR65_LT16074 [Abscondita terminalis]|nr:hypothetical protein FQR65_LT16074 [Abscondita terminalis]